MPLPHGSHQYVGGCYRPCVVVQDAHDADVDADGLNDTAAELRSHGAAVLAVRVVLLVLIGLGPMLQF